MNIQRARRFLRENFIFYLMGILVVLGLKYYYSQAECDSLLWILAPTTHWVEVLSGIPFTYISGTGYVNHSLRLLIAPSCSGVRFMILTIATLVFSFVHIVASPKDAVLPKDGLASKDAALSKDGLAPKDAALSKDSLTPKDAALSKDISSLQGCPAAGSVLRVVKGVGWIAVCVVFSWLFTILVNGLRIIVAIYLPLYLDRVGLMRGLLTPDRLHTMIGIIVFFTALLTLYRLVDYVVQRKTNLTEHSQKNIVDRIIDNGIISKKRFSKTLARKCMPPIFWYFLMTLGLPFLNRAYLKDGTQFKEFAILIIFCIVLILLPYSILSLLHSQKDAVSRCRK